MSTPEPQKFMVEPGEVNSIPFAGQTITKVKVAMIGGTVDIIGHDEPTARVEVSDVTLRPIRIELRDGVLDIDHPQLGWENFGDTIVNLFKNNSPSATVTVLVPRTVALSLSVVSAQGLASGLRGDAKVNTISGAIAVSELMGNLSINGVSADLQVHGLTGKLNANTVSGDFAATGEISAANLDTVSGSVLLDASGPIDSISINTVSGDAAFLFDPEAAFKYSLHALKGTIEIDGQKIDAGMQGAVGSVGQLDGTFVDFTAHSVTGDVTVTRRAGSAS